MTTSNPLCPALTMALQSCLWLLQLAANLQMVVTVHSQEQDFQEKPPSADGSEAETE